MWKGLKDITNYKTPSPSTLENQQLADDFNDFYCRFWKTPHTRPEHLSTQPLTSPATPPIPHTRTGNKWRWRAPGLQREQRRKAPGPDSVSPACLKTYTDQLAPIFTKMFNGSLELCKSPHASNAPPSSPSQRNPQLLDLMTTDLWL